MLHRIENRYNEHLTAILKEFVSHNSSLAREQIKADIAQRLEDHGEIPAGAVSYIHLDIMPGLFITADAKLLPNGEPETTKDSEAAFAGQLVFESFRVRGHWRFFLAFCLQEGELIHAPTLLKGCRDCADRIECYPHMINTLCFKNANAPDLPDISAWVRYVERKYGIYAPPIHGYDYTDEECDADTHLNMPFLEFLTKSHLRITGGIMFDKCLKE